MSLNDVIEALKVSWSIVFGDQLLLFTFIIVTAFALSLSLINIIGRLFKEKYPIDIDGYEPKPKSIIEIPFYAKRRDPNAPIRR